MKYNKLIENLESLILDVSDPYYDEIEQKVKDLLARLYKSEKIKIKEDIHLTGKALELRVEVLFKRMGFQIQGGRKTNLEDFIVVPSKEFETQEPLVIEVKSKNKTRVSRDHLRQLDDRVFDLSGEEEIRKRRLPRNNKNTFYITAGLPPGPDVHPTPHKGVLVFNGPIGVPFANRPQNCIHPNEMEFVEKRFFCIISFQRLLNVYNRFESREINKQQIWETIHKCSGLLEL